MMGIVLVQKDCEDGRVVKEEKEGQGTGRRA